MIRGICDMKDNETSERDEAIRELSGEPPIEDAPYLSDVEREQELERERLERQDEVIREMSGE